MRNISIRPAVNGWIVDVGCQTVVFESLDTLLIELGNYINNPKATEERYLSKAKNKDIDIGGFHTQSVGVPTRLP